MTHPSNVSMVGKSCLIQIACVMAICLSTTTQGAPVDQIAAIGALTLAHPRGRVDFDDVSYLPDLQRIVVPAAQTGDLDLVDPHTDQVSVIAGAAGTTGAKDGQDPGSTSADFGNGYLFIGDHSRTSISIVSPVTGQVVDRVPLASDYDFIRFVSRGNEVWVTEPDHHRIETFLFNTSPAPHLAHAAFIAVPDGPEALTIDNANALAYTNSRTNDTYGISLKRSHTIVRWRNSCIKSRGLVLGGEFLFIGCKEGKVVSLDPSHNGRMIDAASVGPGVDLLAFNSNLHHIYVPGSINGTLTALNVSFTGHLHRLAVYRTVPGAHCVATDNRRKIYVCDPARGALLVYRDRQ